MMKRACREAGPFHVEANPLLVFAQLNPRNEEAKRES